MTQNNTNLKDLILAYLEKKDEESKKVLFEYVFGLVKKVIARHRYILGFEADDVMMNVFLEIVNKIPEIDLPNKKNIESFLYVMIRNAILKYAKEQNKRNFIEIEKVIYQKPLEDEEMDAEYEDLEEKKKDILKDLITGKLPGVKKECQNFYKDIIKGKTKKEILAIIRNKNIYKNDNTMSKEKFFCKKQIIKLIEEQLNMIKNKKNE
jgi:RNA polymerase sigma factor (sigma-70 family)